MPLAAFEKLADIKSAEIGKIVFKNHDARLMGIHTRKGFPPGPSRDDVIAGRSKQFLGQFETPLTVKGSDHLSGRRRPRCLDRSAMSLFDDANGHRQFEKRVALCAEELFSALIEIGRHL